MEAGPSGDHRSPSDSAGGQNSILTRRGSSDIYVHGFEARARPRRVGRGIRPDPCRSTARVHFSLATGANLDLAADQLHVSRETVRNQLKAVFAKTATHHQAELVALLSNLLNLP
jgi:DNA-binding CsgD family transcriptional regulator